jgi:hypothetical protein
LGRKDTPTQGLLLLLWFATRASDMGEFNEEATSHIVGHGPLPSHIR